MNILNMLSLKADGNRPTTFNDYSLFYVDDAKGLSNKVKEMKEYNANHEGSWTQAFFKFWDSSSYYVPHSALVVNKTTVNETDNLDEKIGSFLKLNPEGKAASNEFREIKVNEFSYTRLTIVIITYLIVLCSIYFVTCKFSNKNKKENKYVKVGVGIFVFLLVGAAAAYQFLIHNSSSE